MEAALADGAPLVHDEFGTNASYTWAHTVGDADAVFAAAPVVVKERYVIQRAIPNAMEPRAILVQPNTAMGDYTMWSSTQIPHIVKVAMVRRARASPSRRSAMIAPRVGGGFGAKLQVYAEEALALAGREEARPPDQVGRGALGELPRDPPRPRPDPGDRAGGGRRREDPRATA